MYIIVYTFLEKTEESVNRLKLSGRSVVEEEETECVVSKSIRFSGLTLGPAVELDAAQDG